MNKNLKSKSEVDQAVKNITTTIQNSIEISIPKIKNTNNNNYIYNNPEIKKLILEKNRTRKLFQKNRNPDLKIRKNQLTNEIRFKIREIKNSNWKTRLEKCSTKDNSIWKLTKYFTNKTDSKIPNLLGNVTKNSDKVNLIADQFEKVHKLTENFSSPEHREKIKNKYKKILKKSFSHNEIQYISPREIITAIKSTRPKKSPRPRWDSKHYFKKLTKKSHNSTCQHI